MMGIQNPKDQFDFDCAVLFKATKIEQDGVKKTPEQELECMKNQFRAAGWQG